MYGSFGYLCRKIGHFIQTWNQPFSQIQQNGHNFLTTGAILRPFKILNILILCKKIYFIIGGTISISLGLAAM